MDVESVPGGDVCVEAWKAGEVGDVGDDVGSDRVDSAVARGPRRAR